MEELACVNFAHCSSFILPFSCIVFVLHHYSVTLEIHKPANKINNQRSPNPVDSAMHSLSSSQFGGNTSATRIQYVGPPQQRLGKFPERVAKSPPERPTPDDADLFVGGWITLSFVIRLAYRLSATSRMKGQNRPHLIL